MSYCGFDAEALNSRQPIPKDRAVVYATQHMPWALETARRLRDKYGYNVWVDGTVCTGWKVILTADMKIIGKLAVISSAWDRAANIWPGKRPTACG